MTKTLRIIASLALFACLCSCRTTVPGPSYELRFATQGATPIQLSQVETVEVDFDPGSPARHFLPEADMTFDGGITTRISTTNPAGGDFIIDYPRDFIDAHVEMIPTGFQVRLQLYSRDADAGTGVNPIVHVAFLDATHNAFAHGAGRPVWPLPTAPPSNMVFVAVVCDTGMEAVCNPP